MRPDGSGNGEDTPFFTQFKAAGRLCSSSMVLVHPLDTGEGMSCKVDVCCSNSVSWDIKHAIKVEASIVDQVYLTAQ